MLLGVYTRMGCHFVYRFLPELGRLVVFGVLVVLCHCTHYSLSVFNFPIAAVKHGLFGHGQLLSYFESGF